MIGDSSMTSAVDAVTIATSRLMIVLLRHGEGSNDPDHSEGEKPLRHGHPFCDPSCGRRRGSRLRCLALPGFPEKCLAAIAESSPAVGVGGRPPAHPSPR